MKKSIIKMSTLGLSTLLVACGGGGGGATNAPADNAAQPINPQVQALPQTQSQTPPKKSEKTETAPKAEANVSADNKKNPTEPTVQVSSSQPLAVFEPPKAENQPNVEEPVQSQGRHKRDVAEMNKPRTNVWTGRCETKDFCSSEYKDTLNVYDLKTSESRENSNVQITTEEQHTLQLKLGENTKEHYSFHLLGSSQEDASIYYGYRKRANSDKQGTHYELLHATNNDFTHNTLPEKFSATYKKMKGFIYTPQSYSRTAKTDETILKYGDVEFSYQDGDIKDGKIYDSTLNADRTDPIFTITGKNENLTIESTDFVPTPISPRQKGIITVKFVDSSVNAEDYKYLIGSGQSSSGGKEVGWVGLIFAEKQDPNK
ncbi:hypothetical protein [Pasteurella sp. PK-2025]|uniref:hypothetical protein n=1 Tax=Pasteurella sp. PK-2025 TaxID=3413133 RepID=UPI003C70F935